MATIAQMRTGLKTALSTVAGLRVSETIVGNPSPPLAMVASPTVDFDEAFGGEASYTFPVVVVVARADDRSGQAKLDTFLEPTGATSVVAALHADRTLGGIVDSLRVAQAKPGVVVWGEVEFYQAEFDVEVFG